MHAVLTALAIKVSGSRFLACQWAGPICPRLVHLEHNAPAHLAGKDLRRQGDHI